MSQELLSTEQISSKVSQTPGWSLNGKQIERNFQVKDFATALALINTIGEQAEAMDHHPDMLLHEWNKVKVTVSTHKAGGLTDKDFELAKRINQIPQAQT